MPPPRVVSSGSLEVEMELADTLSGPSDVDPAAFLLSSSSGSGSQLHAEASSDDMCRVIYDGTIEREFVYEISTASTRASAEMNTNAPRPITPPAPIIIHDGGTETWIEAAPKSPTGVFTERLGQFWP